MRALTGRGKMPTILPLRDTTHNMTTSPKSASATRFTYKCTYVIYVCMYVCMDVGIHCHQLFNNNFSISSLCCFIKHFAFFMLVRYRPYGSEFCFAFNFNTKLVILRSSFIGFVVANNFKKIVLMNLHYLW